MKSHRYRAFTILIFFSLTLLLSCKTGNIKKMAEVEKPDKDRLTAFMDLCKRDLDRAGEIIIEKDIVKNLTHLQFMNAGGKRYYLLERENITRMIQAVTKGVYSDYILVNKKGTILYTRDNNKIFSKNVRTHLKSTPLKTAWDRRNIPVYFSPITMMDKFSGRHLMFVSRKVSGGKSFPGILVLQVNAETILRHLEKGEEVLNSEGAYIITGKKEKIFTPCPFFSQLTTALQNKSKGTITLTGGRTVTFRLFNYGTLSWTIIRKKP